MNREQIRAIFEEMARKVTCPSCTHVGMDLSWKLVGAGTGTAVDTVTELPHTTCPGCGAEADGSVPL